MDNEIQELVDRYTVMSATVTSRDAAIRDGYFTINEWIALSNAPRYTDASISSGTFEWPTVRSSDGHVRSLCNFGSLLTEQEKQLYNMYRAQLKAAPRTTRTIRTAPWTPAGYTPQAHSAAAEIVYKAMCDASSTFTFPQEAWDAIDTLYPNRPKSDLELLFGVRNASALTEVNLAYVMLRDKDGNFAPDKQPNYMSLVRKGYVTKFTFEQVMAAVEKLEAAGITARKFIVDLDE